MIEVVEKPLVYVAGPFSKPNPIENVRKAVEAGDRLARMGFGVFIPHLNFAWELIVAGHDYEFWLDQDMQVLFRSNALFRIPGMSDGADREVLQSVSRKIPVFIDYTSIEQWKATYYENLRRQKALEGSR